MKTKYKFFKIPKEIPIVLDKELSDCLKEENYQRLADLIENKLSKEILSYGPDGRTRVSYIIKNLILSLVYSKVWNQKTNKLRHKSGRTHT